MEIKSPIQPVKVEFQCPECHIGKLESTRKQLMSNPPLFEHHCINCGRSRNLPKIYPTIEYEEVTRHQTHPEFLIKEFASPALEEAPILHTMRWIPVQEDDPNPGDNCWVRNINNKIELDIFDGEYWMAQERGSITHWQKLIYPAFWEY
jgi:hypothetical protein